jgi:hypothetical protein
LLVVEGVVINMVVEEEQVATVPQMELLVAIQLQKPNQPFN